MDLFLNPPPWPVILALTLLACVLFMGAAVLVALVPPRRTPMSDRAQRIVRTFVQAFIGSAGVLIAGKLASVKTLEDLSGLASAVVPIVTAGVSAGIAAVMAVVFPPKPAE